MNKQENTVYVRLSGDRAARAGFKFEAFVKAKGEGAIVSGVTHEDAIRAGSQVLWALNKWGPKDWTSHGPIDEHPETPKTFDYPVIDEDIEFKIL